MIPVSVVGIAQIPVKKAYKKSLRQMGAEVIRMVMADAGVEGVDALYVSNMLSDELQGQKHLGALLADEAELSGIEAFQVRAVTASGGAALRVAYLAVASGAVELALAVGVEKMSSGVATPALAKALDAEREVPDGSTLVSQNARLMQRYLEQYRPPTGALSHYSVNAHRNAAHNPNALFRGRQFRPADVLASRVISPPIRLLDCSPICDGAAAVILAPADRAGRYRGREVKILASAVATDRFRMADRDDPLSVQAIGHSAAKAFQQAGMERQDISFFEVHDAFSIMACLSMEAVGFAEPGQGWRLAAEGNIGIRGSIPITTMGGLKARGHPIGATALYQVCEIVTQLAGDAYENQVPGAKTALMQSIGGAASTVITHIFSS